MNSKFTSAGNIFHDAVLGLEYENFKFIIQQKLREIQDKTCRFQEICFEQVGCKVLVGNYCQKLCFII